MFDSIIYETLQEAKSKIDFDSLQFPIYRRNDQAKEFYRFDSVTTLISIRCNNVIGVGVCEISEDTFVKIYSFDNMLNSDVFNQQLEFVMSKINSQK